MPHHRLFLQALLSLAISLNFSAIAKAQTGEETALPSFRVMSFNIRQGAANDGKNSWPQRRELLLKTIKTFSPDLLGTQETQRMQADFLQAQLPDYQYVGKSRTPNNRADEQCAIFFRRDRFVDLEQGHFWLSKTPRVPGSKSWDSSLPRIATWVRLFDRKTKKEIFWINAHFDHEGEIAREQSAIIIRDQIERLSNSPSIVTGDFNASVSSKPHQILLRPGNPITLVDTYSTLHPTASKNEGTFNGFRGFRGSQRIDWILASTDFTVRKAMIVTDHDDDRYPSDHFPVTAVLSLPAK
ncbi:MAG: endonuclease/exonuclease/phosphatase family protein [Pirellulaceae bacterium]|nr:endonuclease/exonuclease/phosphatase family protein [Pirellulaceae bacterium]